MFSRKQLNSHQEPSQKQRTTEKLRNVNKPLSYRRTGELLLEALIDIDFGLYSLRSGGATLIANKGVKNRLFKRHDRWKLENVKDGYIEDNLESVLVVTKSLGL